MPNFSIALTGLQADTVALNTIGNNLANLNTTAFKKQSTTFEDLFYQNIGTSGSLDTLQTGVGTRVSGTSSSFAQGSMTTTQNSTDLALSGNGFFVVDRGNTQSLTRAGNFQLDSAGHLITSSGESVMGYGAVKGQVNLNGGLQALQLPVAGSQSAQQTKNVAITASLNSSAAVGAQFTSPVTLYDSLGQSHAATVSYVKTGTATWNYTVALPPDDATGTPVKTTGTLTFDTAGKLVSPATDVSGISFAGMADGSVDLTFTLNLYDAAGQPLITQVAGNSNTSAVSQDGFTSGVYQGFSVDGSGVIAASFSNGRTAKVGQVAVAMVANSEGLLRTGANDYQATDASGAVTVGVANAGGRATIEGGSLEQSNVDIAAEFADLIVAQRAVEANSKTVTTFDTVTQQAINMIR